MSSFWSVWIMFMTVATILGCYILLTLNTKNYVDVEEGEEMSHEFDGIVEINNPLPTWWKYMFYFTIFWSVLYLVLYPGFGHVEGILKWKSGNIAATSIEESKQLTAQLAKDGYSVQVDQEYVVAEKEFEPLFNKYAEQPVTALVNDEEALKVGKRLFLQNCSQCHGSDAKGQMGFPNLADNDWLYGGTPEQIKETIMHGRIAAMPSWEAALGGAQGVKEMTAYVLSLSGRTVDPLEAAAGKAKFAMCSACHGMDGKGSLANGLPMGAPNLTDTVWLYGGSRKAVEETLRKGRNGVMPAWKDILGEKKVHLITAYIYSLSK